MVIIHGRQAVVFDYYIINLLAVYDKIDTWSRNCAGTYDNSSNFPFGLKAGHASLVGKLIGEFLAKIVTSG